ncbi:hypothetical protein [Thalassotalea atypica]|uniref:hypothetical protein n=1 Tax=Thalassotalea atypica TaxID=2054316 RepID=UPI002573AB9B|nr:hypothetical protein [Thalassotalea atypica]
MNEVFFDAMSWIGLAFCIGAFFIKDIQLLRIATLIGCVLMTVYYSHIEVPQGIVSNIIIVVINFVYLLKRTEEEEDEQSNSTQCLD